MLAGAAQRGTCQSARMGRQFLRPAHSPKSISYVLTTPEGDVQNDGFSPGVLKADQFFTPDPLVAEDVAAGERDDSSEGEKVSKWDVVRCPGGVSPVLPGRSMAQAMSPSSGLPSGPKNTPARWGCAL